MPTIMKEMIARQDMDRNMRLNISIAEFIKRYEPKDRDEAAYFNTHLHEIVRAVYADMTAPVEHSLAATLNMAIPMAPFPQTVKD
jgi:hypothetical protein